MSEPTHFIPYKNLKEYYGNNLNVSYQNAPKKVKSEVRKIEDMNVNLYSKTSNGSPFINSKASVGENATRLYFEPNESRYKDIYLGALFNETQIKGFNVKNWKSFNQENIYLVGKVSSSNVIGLNPKNVFLHLQVIIQKTQLLLIRRIIRKYLVFILLQTRVMKFRLI